MANPRGGIGLSSFSMDGGDEGESEPPVEEKEKTTAETVTETAKAVATAPVKAAVAVATAPVKAAGAVAGAVKDAVIGKTEEEAPEEAKAPPVEKKKAAMGGKLPEAPQTPPETLAPSVAPSTGSLVSGYECQYCGKKYRLERYFTPHLDTCTLNPKNI